MTAHFVSKTCEGERCMCGRPATHKVGEESYPDHPASHPDVITNAAELAVLASLPPWLQPHNLTAYVCCDHFHQIMGQAAPCDDEDPKGESDEDRGFHKGYDQAIDEVVKHYKNKVLAGEGSMSPHEIVVELREIWRKS